MYVEHPEAGTPEPEDVSENAGTPEVEDGSEAGEPEVKPVDGKLAMTWKAKAERVNALEEKLAKLEAAQVQRTTTDNRGSDAEGTQRFFEDQKRELAEEEANLVWLKGLADGGDKAAEAVYKANRSAIRSAKEALQARMDTRYMLEMYDIPEAKRPEVKALMAKTPGLTSPSLAHRFLKGDEHETQAQEIARLRAENEELKKPRPIAERRIPGSSKAGATTGEIPHIPRAKYLEMLEADPHKATSERGKKFIVDYEG